MLGKDGNIDALVLVTQRSLEWPLL